MADVAVEQLGTLNRRWHSNVTDSADVLDMPHRHSASGEGEKRTYEGNSL